MSTTTDEPGGPGFDDVWIPISYTELERQELLRRLDRAPIRQTFVMSAATGWKMKRVFP
jgi:hypothetical protein